MAVTVGATQQHPSHDISLTDGVTTIGLRLCNPRGTPDPRALRQVGMPRTTMQMTNGDPDYGSFVLPYTPIVQKDWSGGRGWEEFNKDSTRYYDSQGIDALHGDVLIGPAPTDTTGVSTALLTSGTQDTTLSSGASTTGFASQFTAPSTSVTSIDIKAMCPVVANGDEINVKIYTDSANLPNTLVATARVSFPRDGVLQAVRVPITATLVAGNKYWIWVSVAYVQGFTVKDATLGICSTDPALGPGIYKYTGTWSLVQAGAVYFVIRSGSTGTFRFFEYNKTVYAVACYDDGSAPRIWRNGLYGLALSNTGALDKLKTGLSLSGLDLTGCVAVIVKGPGSEEYQPWRTITSNTTTGTNDTINVSPSWSITHTTATEFAILGMNSMTEVTGHGLTNPVTDILVVDDIVYFAMGDSITIRRGKMTSGTWAWYWDGTNSSTGNKATFLEMIADTTGVRKIWRANATTSAVSSSAVPAWNASDTTILSFSTDIICGNPQFKITSICPYGNPQIPYIMKEDGFGSISNGVYGQVPLNEMTAVRDERNGRASTQFGVYLFFSLLDGLERYYDGRLDDVGPNRDEGFPSGRQGNVTSLIPYPGGIIACYDGGASGYSSILFWNQIGWHELARSSTSGAQIRTVWVQVIPGTKIDRIWYGEGETVRWIPIALNPRKQPAYVYTSTGSLITSWYKTSFAEIGKFWKSLTLFTENLDMMLGRTITAYYQTDTEGDNDAWHALPTVFYTSPIQEVLLSSTYNVTGKRIRFKLQFGTGTTTISPRLKAMTINAVTRVPPAKTWSVTFLATDAARDMQGRPGDNNVQTLLAKLLEWSDSGQRAAPLTLQSNIPAFDSQYVWIDSPSINPVEVDGHRSVMVGSLSIYGA